MAGGALETDEDLGEEAIDNLKESMRERAQRGIEYVRREHSPQRYLEALDAALQR